MSVKKRKHRILVVEDDRMDIMAFERMMSEGGHDFEYSVKSSCSDGIAALRDGDFDAVVSDYDLGDGIGLDILNEAGGVPVIVVTGAGGEEIAVTVMKNGAFDYLVKDRDYHYLKKLPVTIKNAIRNRRMENELEEYRKKLEEKNAELLSEIEKKNSFCKSLEEKTREMESFVRIASHDLRSPLITLGGYSRRLNGRYRDHLDEQGKKILDAIICNVEYMDTLILDLLELSRVNSGTFIFEMINLDNVLDEVMKINYGRIKSGGIHLRVRSPLGVISGNAGLMKHVFDNLIGNAVKFMGDNSSPEITIGSSRHDGPALVVYVEDNGIGIGREHHERIFTEFERVREIEAEGTGIGLAIVKKIIERHGGRIWVESEPGHGSRFNLLFPDRNERSVGD